MQPVRRLFDRVAFGGPPIDRVSYARWGFILAGIKYAVEAVTFGVVNGVSYTPIDFMNPLLAARSEALEGGPEWLGAAWMIWTLPFIAIALSLSSRRAIDAGKSPWLALLILVPVANLALMIGLMLRPTQLAPPLEQGPAADKALRSGTSLRAAVLALSVGVTYTLLLTVFSVYVLGDYGAALFFGGPAVVGATAGYLLNAERIRTPAQTMRHALLTMTVAMVSMLAFALEGIICLVMAAPILLPMALIGALLGREIARRSAGQEEARQNGLLGALIVLPLLGVVESRLPNPPEQMVETSVIVAASPQDVWATVIAFPPIDSPEPWYFRYGIASPRSARLVGEGVGAVRYCVFTTGEFVEPITAWDAPRRLAFDVVEQPEPMFELTPYREIHPPHLQGALESTRGEFVLRPLGNGRTRLTGRTWYRLRMAPTAYWSRWTDAILHRVHYRVLDHIARVSEDSSRASDKLLAASP